MDFSQTTFDTKYFTTSGLRAVCELSKINDLTKHEKVQVFQDRKKFPRKLLRIESLHPNRPLFTEEGLKRMRGMNVDYMYNDSSRKYYEYAVKTYADAVKFEQMFNQPLIEKHFTVEGLRLYCSLHNVDCSDCVTRKDFCTKIQAAQGGQ